MQAILSRLRQSASIKVMTIGFLILVLLIPLGMIKGTIADRDQISLAAKQDIQKTWGKSQLIAGPVLVVPYDIVHVNDRGERSVTKSQLYFLPNELDIESVINSEVRYRGIHKVPVYSTLTTLSGTMNWPVVDDLGVDATNIHWANASIAVGISDARAIAESPNIQLNNQTVQFVPGGQQIVGLPPLILAPIGKLIGNDFPETLTFSIKLRIKGSDALHFLPLGDTTTANMQSGWPSPSFTGSYLPDTRDVNDAGFTASWNISSIGRALPSNWSARTRSAEHAASSSFGVDLYMPISVYRLTLRATSYGILFVGLTFVVYFLFETVVGLRLHPLQYLMVGLANVLFYLLLVSFAEHIGFGLAYLLSSTASSALTIGYSLSILGGRSRGMVMAGILLVLYSFLYLTLNAETYALLAGSLGLWVTLAMIMYLTRRIDWFAKTALDNNDA
jgi:inner membrane protein